MSAVGFFHCAVKPVGRATGRSAVAAAAYRAAETLRDERTGLTHHYAERRGVLEAFMILPKNAPEWAKDRASLWNAAEAATTAKNGRIATELELALPCELSTKQRRELVKNFAQEIADRGAVAVDVAIHAPGKGGDNRNFHAHVLITHRTIGAEGFGSIAGERTIERRVNGVLKSVKMRGLFNEPDIIQTRKAWADAENSAYRAAGLDIRVDSRSHRERGLDAEPTKHLGPAATAIERRGEATDRGNMNREIVARNNARSEAEAERISVAAAIAELEADRQNRADARELRAAIRTASATRILDAMTEKRATFTRAELVHLFAGHVAERSEAQALATELLAHPDIIGLRETATAAVTRYTTRQVLVSEKQVLQTARELADAQRGGVSQRTRNATLHDHPRLDEEQREAFDHATQGGRLTLIAGEAGTGKTTTLAAIRDAYERGGRHVIGLSWTNKLVQAMQADGFKNASTISAALQRIEGGREAWGRDTVLIVDEAAMLSSRSLGRLLKAANANGASVILAGDEKQLSSIERGGLFGALTVEHGAAELHTVYRATDNDQKAAFNLMHAGRFGDALAIFNRAGAIRWTQTQDEARAALVAKWAVDTKAEPEKSRFVFAYSNADVAALNADMRAVRRERGELGPDHFLDAKDGPAAFAKGDRVQFTGSARNRTGKAAGLVAGGMGTVTAIQGARMTVALDGAKEAKPRLVSFTVGADEAAGQFNAIRHGYAGTIYKGQGATVDQAYLFHSKHWRASSAYVALSRHRESVNLFVAREVTAGAEPWMMKQGGLDALDEKHRDSAARSYEAWAEANPKAGATFGLPDYVAYVQTKQAERGRDSFDLAQLEKQIGRADETRAASQFVPTETTATEQTGKGERPNLAGPIRTAFMKAAAFARQHAADPLAAVARRTATRRVSPLGKYDELQQINAPQPDDPRDLLDNPTLRDLLEKGGQKDAVAHRAAMRRVPPLGKYDELRKAPEPKPGEAPQSIMDALMPRDLLERIERETAEQRERDKSHGRDGKGYGL